MSNVFLALEKNGRWLVYQHFLTQIFSGFYIHHLKWHMLTNNFLSLIRRRKPHLMKLGPSAAPLLRHHTGRGLRFSGVSALSMEEDSASIRDFFEPPILHNAYMTHKIPIQTQFGSKPGIWVLESLLHWNKNISAPGTSCYSFRKTFCLVFPLLPILIIDTLYGIHPL